MSQSWLQSDYVPFAHSPRDSAAAESVSRRIVIRCRKSAQAAIFSFCSVFFYAFLIASPAFEGALLLDEREVPDFSYQEARKFLDGQWRSDTIDERHQPILNLLRKLQQSSEAEDDQSLAELIDWGTRMKRYERAYRFRPIPVADWFELVEIEKESCRLPVEATDFRIAAIVDASADDCFVYAYAQRGALAHTPFVFHFRQTGGIWKFVDLRGIPDAYWNAEYNALVSGPAHGDPAVDSQHALHDTLLGINEMLALGQHKAAAQALNQAHKYSGVPELRGHNAHVLATYWYALKNYQACLQICRSINNPDRIPRAHYQTALAQYQLGHHSEALAAIERYEVLAGFHAELAWRKIHCQEELGQPEVSQTRLALEYYDRDNIIRSRTLIDYSPATQGLP